MKRFAFPLIVIISLAGIFVFAIRTSNIHPFEGKIINVNTILSESRNSVSNAQAIPVINSASEPVSSLRPPMSDALTRITKKPFGIYITPATSPVSPEKFSGFHSGVDFETFEHEQNIDVEVFAVCDGVVQAKQRVSGYGGVFIQNCTINNESVTVLYGHLTLSSISFNSGDTIKAGNSIGLLGAPYSQDTDGERKHLHLGIHKGAEINYKGYVQGQSMLSDWLDAESLL